jgi:TrmH family RNA methyltransferase
LLKSPQDAWALVYTEYKSDPLLIEQSELVLALDTIQDPGNLGTIIRLADWFGVRQIWCSSQTVDVYNPKVVQASMGSIFRVHMVYGNLFTLLAQHSYIPIYAADLQGENVYTQQLPKQAIVVMGNEGNGISQEILPFISTFLHIPSFSTHSHKPESLNVSVATAILCSEFKRIGQFINKI